jgi:hypothetical protein
MMNLVISEIIVVQFENGILKSDDGNCYAKTMTTYISGRSIVRCYK